MSWLDFPCQLSKALTEIQAGVYVALCGPEPEEATSAAERAKITATRTQVNDLIGHLLPNDWVSLPNEDPYIRFCALMELYGDEERAATRANQADHAGPSKSSKINRLGVPKQQIGCPLRTTPTKVNETHQRPRSPTPAPKHVTKFVPNKEIRVKTVPKGVCFICGSNHMTKECDSEVYAKASDLETVTKVFKTSGKFEAIYDGKRVCVRWLYVGQCKNVKCKDVHTPCTLCGNPAHHPAQCAYGLWKSHQPVVFQPTINLRPAVQNAGGGEVLGEKEIGKGGAAGGPGGAAGAGTGGEGAGGTGKGGEGARGAGGQGGAGGVGGAGGIVGGVAGPSGSEAGSVPVSASKLSAGDTGVHPSSDYGDLVFSEGDFDRLDLLSQKPREVKYLRLKHIGGRRPGGSASVDFAKNKLPDVGSPLGSDCPINPSFAIAHPSPSPVPEASDPFPYSGVSSRLKPAQGFRSRIHAINLFDNPAGEVAVPRLVQDEIIALLDSSRKCTLDEYYAEKGICDAAERKRIDQLLAFETLDGQRGDEGAEGVARSVNLQKTRQIKFRTQLPDGVPSVSKVIVLANWPSAHESPEALTTAAFSTRLLLTAGLPPQSQMNSEFCFFDRLPLKFSAATSNGPRYLSVEKEDCGVSEGLQRLASDTCVARLLDLTQTGRRLLVGLGKDVKKVLERLVEDRRQQGWDVFEWDWEYVVPVLWEAGVEMDPAYIAMRATLQNFAETSVILDIENLQYSSYLRVVETAQRSRRKISKIRFTYIRNKEAATLLVHAPYPQVAAVPECGSAPSAQLDLILRSTADVLHRRFSGNPTDLPPPVWPALSAWHLRTCPTTIDNTLFGASSSPFKGYAQRAALVTRLANMQNTSNFLLPAICLPSSLKSILGQVEECFEDDEGARPWVYRTGDHIAKLAFYGSLKWRVRDNAVEQDDDPEG